MKIRMDQGHQSSWRGAGARYESPLSSSVAWRGRQYWILNKVYYKPPVCQRDKDSEAAGLLHHISKDMVGGFLGYKIRYQFAKDLRELH